MPLTGNSITDKKLVRAKRMYQHAVLQATGQPDEMRRIRAVLEFDWVIELTLKAVLGHLNPGKTPSEKLGELLQELDNLLAQQSKPPVPDRGHILHVRAIRNAAQHTARDPTTTELAECQIYTRDFLTALLPHVWGVTLDQVSLTSLIQTPLLAEVLQEAEQALDAQDWPTATESSMLALELATTAANDQLIDVHWERAFGGIWHSIEEDAGRDVAETLESIQRVLRLLVFGVDYTAHMAFLKTAGSIARYLGNGYEYIHPPEGITEPLARAAVTYVLELVLQMEQRVGDLKARNRPKRFTKQSSAAPPVSTS